MNVKKIIKGIMGLSAVAGIAYLSYKIGESSGEVNERLREKYGDEDDIEFSDDEDEYRFYDNMDEPDDECLAPKKEYMPSFTVSMHNFAPLDSIKVDGISDRDMDMLIYHISLDKYTSNKQIREWLKVDKETAAKVIAALRKAEYIGKEYPNYIIPVHITTEVYFRLRGDLR
ncbi:MAG: hypothetical protein ACLR1S_09090 [Ruminococcus bicirculans (ex Wegman et al. 2014)]